MEPEAESTIVRLLVNKFNPWWGSRKEMLPAFKRADFFYLLGEIKKEKAITLVGPRQVGKTTLVKQMIHALLEQGVANNRIFYVDLGDVEIRLTCKNPLHEVLQIYQKYILHEDFANLSSDVYLFFDEVQKDSLWNETVRSYKTYPKLRMLSTGSSSRLVSKMSNETLPGRANLQVMLPLKFSDFLRIRFMSKASELNADAFRSFGKEMRNWFTQGLLNKNLSEFIGRCQERLVLYLGDESKLQAELSCYLSRGGYPGVALKESTAECQQLLNGYANDVIAKDLTVDGSIRDVDLAEKLLYLLAGVSANELNKNSLLNRLQPASYITVNKYLVFFKEVLIISEIPIYSGSKLGSTKHPKLYFQDVGLRNALLGVLDLQISDADQGQLAETVACDHLKRLSFKLNLNTQGHIYCLKPKSTQGVENEIDFILDLPRFGLLLPIECKFRRNIKHTDAINDFMTQHNQSLGVVLTRDTLKYEEKIAFIPLWMFLLMC